MASALPNSVHHALICSDEGGTAALPTCAAEDMPKTARSLRDANSQSLTVLSQQATAKVRSSGENWTDQTLLGWGSTAISRPDGTSDNFTSPAGPWPVPPAVAKSFASRENCT